MDSDEIIIKALKYKNYFGHTGGITLSGGEPLMQAEFASEVLQKCHEQDINTVIDTAGYELTVPVKKCLAQADLVMVDLKHSNPEKHKELTGCELSRTLKFIEYLSLNKIKYWVRHVIVPGLTDSEDEIMQLIQLISKYRLPEKIELLPYHSMAVEKWAKLGKKYMLANTAEPTTEKMKQLQELVNSKLVSLTGFDF
jgi:pyruvate formate lyase activating enzyme